jgi:hypothetical protein
VVQAASEVTLTAIVVIESLCPGEVKTGRELAGYVGALVEDAGLPLLVRFETVGSLADLRAFLLLVQGEMRQGARPQLHFEMHGSNDGLVLANGELIAWTVFCELLRPLNVLSGHRLGVVLAACFGIGIILGVNLRLPAPCQVMIGPTLEMDPGEVMGVFRAMYRAMLTTLNPLEVAAALAAHQLQQGAMMVLTATGWFHMLMTNYLSEHATRQRMKELALLHHQSQVIAGVGRRDDMVVFKRVYKANIPRLVRQFYCDFHLYDLVSHTRGRFEPSWPALERKVALMLSRL